MFAGFRAPSPGRRPAENSPGLGAKGTEGQGFAGNRAPSPCHRLAENSPGLGAKGTEAQGFAGYCAPSPSRRPAEKPLGLGAKGTEGQGFAGFRAPSPGRRLAGGSTGPIKLSALRTHNPICLEKRGRFTLFDRKLENSVNPICRFGRTLILKRRIIIVSSR